MGFIVFLLVMAAIAAFALYKTNEEFRVHVTAAIAAASVAIGSYWDVIAGWFAAVQGWFS